jgi:hypothetical protein
VLAWMWRCLLAGASPSEELRSASRAVGTNGIDQRCGRGEARPLALVDRSPLLIGMAARCLVNAPGRDIITGTSYLRQHHRDYEIASGKFATVVAVFHGL